MEAWATELLHVWETNIDLLAEELKKSFDRDPSQVGKYNIEDLRQMMRGGIAIMQAELAGQGAEMREAYLQSVVPGLFNQGLKLDTLAGANVVLAMRTLFQLAPRISPENREQAGDFICTIYRLYTTDQIRVGLEILSGKSS